jgi:hypothetical protein
VDIYGTSFYNSGGFSCDNVFALMGLLFSVWLALSNSHHVGILFLEPVITAFMTLAEDGCPKSPIIFSANVNAIDPNDLPGGFGGGGPFGNAIQMPSVTHAFVVLGIYMLFFVSLSLYLFHKRDVTG